MRVTLLLAGILMVFLLVHVMVRPQEEPSVVKFSEFMDGVSLPADDLNKVTEVTFKENEIKGTRADKSTFKTYGPNDSDLRKELQSLGIQVNYDPPDEMSWWKTLLINSLPMLLRHRILQNSAICS